ncbi:recombinase family protein [Microbacterium sp. NPDC096154]|uniref:recombinase family protein n=1 Tax=Microbacterium sp. NPDC096154 TaxID=3155549 RepID=UPI00331C8A84
MRVLAYLRVSTEEQAEKGNSIPEQKERITAFCVVKGWSQPQFFVDDGYSAKNTNRPELTKLLEVVKTEPNGIVITTKLDRLSRKLFDILSLNEFFFKYEYNFVSATEGFDTSTPAGRLVLQMLGMVAEFERERISENVKNNMNSIARNTKRVITRPCFGYDVINGAMVVNIEESLIVKKMATWALNGEGSRAIAKKLNIQENVKTKDGNEWHDKVVRELLQRESLIGTLVYNKTYKSGGKIKTRPIEEWIIVEDHHEPILELDVFEKIQELFEGRKTIGRHINDDRYILSGLVYCSHCKNKMNGKTNKYTTKKNNEEKINYTYLCDGYLKKAICYHHRITRDALENQIIDLVEQTANSYTNAPLEIKIAKVEETIDKDKIKKQLTKLDNFMQKQIEAYNEDLITKRDLKIASEKTNLEREHLIEMLESSEKDREEKSRLSLMSKIKEHKNIKDKTRIEQKAALRQIIHSISVENGELAGVVWIGF